MKENSIEEDIKIIRSIDTLDDFELENAINHILSDYKRLLKENEELREYNAKLIAVQKVKDKEEQDIENTIKVLQELLESEEMIND